MKTGPVHERRREAPAESTAQISWLVAAIMVCALPHIPYVHLWIPVMVLTVSGWRLWLAASRRPLPSGWLRVPLTLAAFAGILATYRQISGIDAGSSLLLVMVAMKLLESRGHRDRAVVVFICYFLLFAAFLREQPVWAPVYLGAGVLVATTALLQTTRHAQAIPARHALRLSGRLLAQALPLMLLLFFLFPRIPGPFWSLPQRSGQAITGLADSMSPGDITELAISDEVAFRVQFDGDIPPSAKLYWRGPVFEYFDGRRWSGAHPAARLPDSRQRTARAAARARRVDYEITLEPSERHWLLALETPLQWDADHAWLGTDYALIRAFPVDQRLAYRASSVLDGITPGGDEARGHTADTRLPARTNPLTRAWARQQRAKYPDDRAFIASVLDKFRNEEFFYSLTPPALGPNPIDEFLFNTKEGFCGHYASALAVLARAAGIPARVVTGYQGGELNPLGNYWIVRQADAHAWVEVWLDGHWERIDPTAAVAPERIEWGMDAAMDRGRIGGATARLRNNLLAERLLMSWDAANAAWNRWVLAFGPKSQAMLLKLAGIPHPSSRHLLMLLTVGMSIWLGWVAWRQHHQRRPRTDALLRVYWQLCERTARVTRPRHPNEGPLEYADATARQRPDLAVQLRELFSCYAQLRYDGTASPAALAEFIGAVRRFRPRRSPADAPATTATGRP